MQFRFLRTESFRLTAIFAGLLIGAMLVLMVIVYVTMHQAFRTQLLMAAEHDLASVRKALSSQGMPEAKEVVAQLLAKSATSEFFLLQSGTKTTVAGNLPAMDAVAGERIIPMPASLTDGREDREDQRIIGMGTFFAPGLYAFAGRDLAIADDSEEDVLAAFAWILAATLVLALGGGLIVSNAFLGRMDAISRTCRAIMAGHLRERIPVRGTRDELDRLVVTINEMLDRIGALMENIQQISSDIAHDLRTPLTRLRHHLEQARAESTTVEDYSLAVGRAISDSESILTTFSALLRIGQIEGRSEPAKLVTVDLAEILRQLVEIYRPAAEDSGFTLEEQIESPLLVAGDRELLSQLFANLIENALTHTAPGTVITVALSTAATGIVASVRDTGPGISADEHEKVLRRFYRLERARTRPGSGLGLSLVAAIVQYHEATMTLDDNQPGLSVVVTFRIPS